MRKRTYFEEIWFCNEFYIGGIDVLSDESRIYIKDVQIMLSDYSNNFPYKRIDNARLYSLSVNGIKFKIAVAQLYENIRIIAYLSQRSFMKSIKANDEQSRNKNVAALRKFALQTARQAARDTDDYYYSKDNSTRIKIERRGDCFVAHKEKFFLNPDATINIPEDLLNEPYTYLGWYENDGSVSVYDSIEKALNGLDDDLTV